MLVSKKIRDSAGNWAGIVSSSVYVGAFCSSYIWGKFSDRFGKRPCLLIGIYFFHYLPSIILRHQDRQGLYFVVLCLALLGIYIGQL